MVASPNLRTVFVLAVAVMVGLVLANARSATLSSGLKAPVPSPALDEPRTPSPEPRVPSPARKTMVVAGGCFWGVQAVFSQVKGVLSATSGYAGGSKPADYETVSSGRTGHA